MLRHVYYAAGAVRCRPCMAHTASLELIRTRGAAEGGRGDSRPDSKNSRCPPPEKNTTKTQLAGITEGCARAVARALPVPDPAVAAVGVEVAGPRREEEVKWRPGLRAGGGGRFIFLHASLSPTHHTHTPSPQLAEPDSSLVPIVVLGESG
jgi:hypothetical protein